MRYVSLILTLLLLAGMFLDARTHPTQRSADPYHARIATAATHIPLSFGSWNGTDGTANVPAAARKLLRPNVLVGRTYRDDATGIVANLIFVQCRDTQDMGGHYPPNCYPNSGWTIRKDRAEDGEPGIPLNLRVGNRTLHVREYEFRQKGFPDDRVKRIYSFFVIPGLGIADTLTPVRVSAEDYKRRPFGAAQVQVVVDGSVPDAGGQAAFSALIEQILPLIDMVEQNRAEVSHVEAEQ